MGIPVTQGLTAMHGKQNDRQDAGPTVRLATRASLPVPRQEPGNEKSYHESGSHPALNFPYHITRHFACCHEANADKFDKSSKLPRSIRDCVGQGDLNPVRIIFD